MSLYLGIAGGTGIVLVLAAFFAFVLGGRYARSGRAGGALVSAAALIGLVVLAAQSAPGAALGFVLALVGWQGYRWLAAARLPEPDIVVEKPLLADATLSPELMSEMLKVESQAREASAAADRTAQENTAALADGIDAVG